jgi:SEC-C motif
MTGSTAISFVLTSCARFDLLSETLASFLASNTAPIERYVIVEDSGDRRVRDVLASFDQTFELVFNDPPRGQMASIDLAYSGVDTPYIFHCEDDWRFFRQGFVEESLQLLEAIPSISTVKCRRAGQNALHDRITYSAEMKRLRDIEYRQPALDAHPIWGGYSLNPGLRRLADWRALGSFAACGHERDLSLWFKGRGMGIASLERPACETTGHGRHVHDVFAPASWNAAIGSMPPLDTSAPGSRNALCPCGSGRRYKRCHGANR